MIPTTFLAVVLPLLAAFAGVAEATSCNATSPCPSSAPCCSEYGFCGTDSFCLGGCNPFASTTLDSCRPEPLCKNSNFTFADQSRILSNSTFFDGNSSAFDWTVDKGNIQSSDGSLALILTQTNGGTRISSTRYVHYGTITASLKTGRWGGVVTAFITMSNVKDEIDWEFPGGNTTEGQSNFFWQGLIPDKTNGGVHGGLTDTYSNYHDYTIDWQPDALTFSIDSKVVRTVKKTDTVDAKGVANYPTTPARIQISLWPAGIPGTPQGTLDWAGGLINWDDPDYKSAGQFYALVKSVSVQCSDAKVTTLTSNITSYVYSGNRSDPAPTILYTNRTALLNGAGRIAPIMGGVSASLVALSMSVILGINALLL